MTKEVALPASKVLVFAPERLKARRKAAGMSRTELAYHVGRAEQTIAQWERGEMTPSSDALMSAAQALGIEITDLYGPVNNDDPR